MKNKTISEDYANYVTYGRIRLQLFGKKSDSNGKSDNKKRMSEEEKKKKFGDKYDPDFKKRNKDMSGKGQECDKPAPEKGDEPERREEPKDKPARRFNDYRFYALSEEIAKDIGSFPYSNLSGTEQKTSVLIGNTSAPSYWNDANVGRIRYVNAQVANGETDDGLATAANQLYTFLNHNSSGAQRFEPADAIMFVLAMRDIYAAYGELRRAIGLTNFFAMTNRSIPRQFIEAMGIDYDDLIDNITLYRGRLNKIAKTINSIAVPRYFSAFERADFITGNVFADSNSVRGQFYMYVREGYYTWSGTTDEHGTQLIYSKYNLELNSTTKKYESWNTKYQILKSMVNAVYTDVDGSFISGMILHAFKDEEIYQLGQITDEYVVVPIMDEDALSQIENAIFLSMIGPTTINSSNFGTTMNVTQSNGQAKWKPQMTLSYTEATKQQYLMPTTYVFNSHKDNPDYKDNLEWSRLMPTYSVVESTVQDVTVLIVTVESCCMELPIGLDMFMGASAITTEPTQVTLRQKVVSTSTATTVSLSTLNAIIIMENYDWHPFIYQYILQTGTQVPTATLNVGGDIKKYTLLSIETIAATNDAATQACFYGSNLYAKKRTNASSKTGGNVQ